MGRRGGAACLQGPSVIDWYPDEPLLPQTRRRVRVTDTLPKPWPDFARSTLVASGGNYVPFDPYGYQIDLIRTIRKHTNTYVLKSRQTGVSETVISYMLSQAIRKPAWTGVVFSKTGDDASELAARIKGQASTLRDRCPKFSKDSMRKIVFEGAGSLHFLPPTERAARGIPSASFILFDEAAFIDRLAGIETGALPTTSMLGHRARHVWVSTPNGRSGPFCDHWQQDHGEIILDATPTGFSQVPRLACSPDGQFAKVAIHYSQHPIYGAKPTWAEETRRRRQLTEKQWRQEYELDFAASDHEIFAHELIAQAEDAGGWELPRRGHTYVMGIDPNGGGGDNFAIIVLDITTAPWRVVAGFYENLSSRDYGLQHAAMLYDQYQPALTVVEKNGVGNAVGEALVLMRPGLEVEEISTSKPNKILNTDRIVLLLEQQELTIPPDCYLGREMRAFRQDEKGNRAAASGQHDDAVMALAMACHAGSRTRPMNASWVMMA